MKKYLLIIAVFVALSGCHKHDKLWDSIVGIENRLTILEQQCREMNTNISSMRVVVDVVQNNDYVTGVSTVLDNGIEVGYKISFNTNPAVIIYHGKNGQDGRDGQDGSSGETGSDGQNGLSPVIGVKQAEDGKYYWTQKLGTAESTWILDDNGNKVIVGGSDGQSVLTPHIGSNGNWWIGETDTYVKASGNDGQNGTDGKDGQDGQDGQDGKDGLTPRIGSNGNWWIGYTDTGIKARGETGKDGQNGQDGKDGQNGQDGRDGITPQLKIENDNWMLSVDNGLSWRNLGKAKGDDGESFFTNIINEDDKLILELEDGTSIELPKKQSFSFSLSNTCISNVQPNRSYRVGYTINGVEEQKTHIEIMGPDGWEVSIERRYTQNGDIIIKTPELLDADGKVLVFVATENGTTCMQSITMLRGSLSVTQKEYTLDPEGGTITVNVNTNIDYQVNIASGDRNWIHHQTESGNREKFTLTIDANSAGEPRNAIIELVNTDGFVLDRIKIIQKSSGPIHVATPGTLETLISTAELNLYKNMKITGHLNSLDYNYLKSATGLRTLDLSDLDDTNIPASAFAESTLTNVILPKNLQIISSRAFYQSKITSIQIPETVTEIGDYAFSECKQVQSDIIIPNSVKNLEAYAFSGCSGKSLTLSTQLREIKEGTFQNSTIQGNLVLPPNLLTIGKSAFLGNRFVGNLIIPDKVTSIGEKAFHNCTGFKGHLVIGKNVATIGKLAFTQKNFELDPYEVCYIVLNFSKIYFKPSNPPRLLNSFRLDKYTSPIPSLPYVAVPVGCKEIYRQKYSFTDKASELYAEIVEEVNL